SLSSVAALVLAGLPVSRAKTELEIGMARRARRAWLALAWLEGASLLSAFDADSAVTVLVCLAVTPVVFGIGSLLLVKIYRRNGDLVRAELARFVGLYELLFLPVGGFLLMVAVSGSRFGVFAILAATALFLLLLPVSTAVLVGLRPPPLDLAGPSFTRERSDARILVSLVVLAAVAALANVVSTAFHLESCAGSLVAVPEPKEWRAFPVIAKGDDKSLGPFRVHGYTESYKNYPSGLDLAELGDPKLCFGGTVPLGAWFDGSGIPAMYRYVGDLTLLHDPKSGTFVVSGTDSLSPNPPRFVVAFRREETRRLGFDSPEAKHYVGLGWLSLALGAGVLALWRHRIRHLHVDPLRVSYSSGTLVYLAYLAFAISLGAPIVLAFSLIEKPRPGAEIFVRYVSP
ncbi:MAG TPA: hypothetical protein VF103_18260, partial [Polyangiaceae bacterium]